MMADSVPGYELGKIIIEGKTKKVYEIKGHPGQCILINKDRITAGDGARAHDLKGKAEISNATNAKVFELLNSAGIKSSFIKKVSENAFLAEKCEMVPIEWVTRRIATGSFLKRNPGVEEGTRFTPPLQETFFKDDANHDPLWSEQQLISAKFQLNGLTITRHEIDIMRRTSLAVFEVLEKAWASINCTLVDMKIEFGVSSTGEILVSDVIDSDSWRLWPSGDKRLMKDKQVYRNLAKVTQEDLQIVKNNFQWVADQLEHLIPPSNGLVVVLMGSPSDEQHCQKIKKTVVSFGVDCELRVTSAHKETEETLKMLAEYEGCGAKVVFIAVAGRSNGLGPVLSGNTVFPVINCPPVSTDNVSLDIWSSLNIPSGLGCTTVMYPEAAALAALQIHAFSDHVVWSKLRVKALNTYVSLKKADQHFRATEN